MARHSVTPIVFIGADPGVNGGLAAIVGGAVSAVTMPRTERSVWDWFQGFTPPPREHQSKGSTTYGRTVKVVAGIELVTGYIPTKGESCPKCGQQKAGANVGSRMFTFGQSYGALWMAMIGNFGGMHKDWLPITVPPQTWQRGLGIDPRRPDESDSTWKNRLKWNAEQLFPKEQYPNLRITLRVADALLIALYTKREYEYRHA